MNLNRRRFLTIVAASSLAGVAGMKSRAASRPLQWKGLALGAEASITIGGDEPNAKLALDAAVDTVRRMENLFSIYDPASDLSKLNRTGKLNAVPEFLRLISLSDRINMETDGLFDPTIQPLFEHQLEQARADDALERLARRLVGWENVEKKAGEVSLQQEGIKLTFNGIAQGFATDRVSEVLAAFGFDEVVVNIGEYRVGRNPFELTIADTNDRRLKTLTVQNAAMATTSPSSFRFEDGSTHLIRPDGKHFKPHWETVSVQAKTATAADGYSTAIGLTTDTGLAERLLAQGVVNSIFLQDVNGRVIEL